MLEEALAARWLRDAQQVVSTHEIRFRYRELPTDVVTRRARARQDQTLAVRHDTTAFPAPRCAVRARVRLLHGCAHAAEHDAGSQTAAAARMAAAVLAHRDVCADGMVVLHVLVLAVLRMSGEGCFDAVCDSGNTVDRDSCFHAGCDLDHDGGAFN